MSQYDLIAFDMDGTLLDSDKKIRDDSLMMIRKAVAAGKVISLSTGRNLSELENYFKELPELGYCICASGALVLEVSTKKRIYENPLSPETIRQLFDAQEERDLMIHLHSERSIVQAAQESHMADYNMGQYQGLFDRVAIKPVDLRAYYEENLPAVYKFNYYLPSPQARTELHAKVADYPITIAYAEEASLECSVPGVSKGTGLAKLCEYLNIPISRSIAVGDADNDLEILKTAGLAVAMGNSKPSVLEIADVVVSDCDHGGCAEAISRFLL